MKYNIQQKNDLTNPKAHNALVFNCNPAETDFVLSIEKI